MKNKGMDRKEEKRKEDRRTGKGSGAGKGRNDKIERRRNIKWGRNIRSIVFSLFNKCNIRS